MDEREPWIFPAVAGLIMVSIGIAGFWRIRFALLHHTFMWWTGRGGPTWIAPWQATLASGLFFFLGVYCLADAFQKRRK
jgi:putative Mn2+ efflux pump MntP